MSGSLIPPQAKACQVEAGKYQVVNVGSAASITWNPNNPVYDNNACAASRQRQPRRADASPQLPPRQAAAAQSPGAASNVNKFVMVAKMSGARSSFQRNATPASVPASLVAPAAPASLAPAVLKVGNASSAASSPKVQRYSEGGNRLIGSSNLEALRGQTLSEASGPEAVRGRGQTFAEPREDTVMSREAAIGLLTNLLSNRNMLKAHVARVFKEASCNEELSIMGLKQLQALIISRLGMTTHDVFGCNPIDVDFERFDFNGSGSLSVNQTYKLVKFNFAEYRGSLAGSPKSKHNCAIKSLEGAGITLIRELGQGSYGTATLAHDRHGKEICIKCFPKDRLTTSGIEDLCHEFERLNLLSCEAIAGASELFMDNNMYYLVGEVYYGGDLETLERRALDQGVVPNEDWWRSIFRQILEGIAFMHEQATIHCDIKEPNLMVKTTDYANPKCVIIDLGVAVSMAKDDEGSPHGTPGYVPPETLETMIWYPRGDLFSMGVVMMQMMIGKVPSDTTQGIFQEDCGDVREIFVATRTRAPPIHLMPPEWPELSDLVGKLLQKRRQDRPTASQALRDPWFRSGSGPDEGTAAMTWAMSDAAQALNPKNAFATAGITDYKVYHDGYTFPDPK